MAKLTARQAGERMGVSASTVYQLCAERRLPHTRVSATGKRGKILIAEGDVDDFLAANKVEAATAVSRRDRILHSRSGSGLQSLAHLVF